MSNDQYPIAQMIGTERILKVTVRCPDAKDCGVETTYALVGDFTGEWIEKCSGCDTVLRFVVED